MRSRSLRSHAFISSPTLSIFLSGRHAVETMASSNSSLCLTPACIAAASHLVWQMAPNWATMDPCTEFEQMVCYRYQEQNHEDKGIISITTEQNLRVLREMLELPYEEAVHYQSVPWKSTFPINSVDEANFDMLRRAYQTCLDTDAIAEAGTAPLKELVHELTSVWPMVPGDVKTTVGKSDYAGLTEAIYYLADLGIQPLVEYDVIPHYWDDPVCSDGVHIVARLCRLIVM